MFSGRFPSCPPLLQEVLFDGAEYWYTLFYAERTAAAHSDCDRRIREGHNSAARGVRDALAGRAEVRVTDLCAEAMPRMFRLTRAAYLWTISRMPRLWKWMYEVSDRRNMAEKPVRGIAPVERLLERLLREWKPDAVVCTYMVYPYMLDSLASRTGRAVPYLTVVTDSFVINKSWLCSKSPSGP